jgi:O-antigen ligase
MTKGQRQKADGKRQRRRSSSAILLGLCLCILALRVTYTEAPVAQMLTSLGGFADTIYSLTLSGLLISAFVFWLVLGILRRRFSYRVTGMEIGLVLLGIAAVIASIGASDKRAAITQTAALLSPVLAAILLAQILDSDARIRLVLAVIVALGVVSAYQCAEQFFVSNKITIEQYEQNPKLLLDPLGIEPGTFQQFLFEHRLYSRGIRGFFTTSNSAASFGIMASFAAIVLLMRRIAESGAGKDRLRRVLLPALATAIVVAGLLLTQSKGGILAFIAALAAFATLLALRRWLSAHRRLAAAILIPSALLLIVVAGYVTISYGLQRGSLPGGNSMFVRWQYWSASARMYADHPWTGVGPGNFSNYYSRYKPAAALESVSDPHDFLLSIATQFGPLGLLGFLAMIFGPLVRLVASPANILSAEQTYPPSAFRRPALMMLLAVCGSLLFVRPLLIPSTSAGDPGVLLYEILTIYVTPAAAFLIGFLLIAAPLETSLPQRSRFGPAVLLAAATSAILAVLLHNLIDFAIFEPGVWMTFWIMMACLVAADPRGQMDASPARQPAPAWRRAIVGTALVLLAVYFLYVWRPVWKATVGIQRAQRAAAAGQFDRAHDYLDAAFAADPLSATAVNLNGRLYMEQADQPGQDRAVLLEAAARSFRRAIETDPADYKNYEKLAQAYGRLKQWQDAFDSYRKSVELYPGSERLWFHLAQTAEQLSKPDAALGYYTKAVEIEESYQQQFRRMYPNRDKVVSRLGEDELALARNRIQELSRQTQQD